MRRPMIAGNWKMNGSCAFVTELTTALRVGYAQITQADLVVFPPYVYLPIAAKLLANSEITWGGQDLSAKQNGPYTGDISAEMLLDFHCQYVLIGHSERRQLHAESNDLVAAKTSRALEAGLWPIVCVGETLTQRENNQALAVIREQIAAITKLNEQENFERTIFAYEPVWAIGTGKSATPEQAQEIHHAIRKQLGEINVALANKTRILYGGSVKPDNAAALFSMTDIDGALVGGASLEANKFLQIGMSCNNLY